MSSTREQPTHISDEMLDQLIGDRDPQELFRTGELFDELKRRLAERMLDAEMDHHLAHFNKDEERGGLYAAPLYSLRSTSVVFRSLIQESYLHFDNSWKIYFAKFLVAK